MKRIRGGGAARDKSGCRLPVTRTWSHPVSRKGVSQAESQSLERAGLWRYDEWQSRPLPRALGALNTQKATGHDWSLLEEASERMLPVDRQVKTEVSDDRARAGQPCQKPQKRMSRAQKQRSRQR